MIMKLSIPIPNSALPIHYPGKLSKEEEIGKLRLLLFAFLLEVSLKSK